MQPSLLSTASVTQAVRVVSDHGDGFRWSALSKDVPILRMAGVYLSPRVLDLVLSPCLSTSDEICRQACRDLLTTAASAAAAHDLRELRLLTWQGQADPSRTCLAECGFAPAVQLQTWTSQGIFTDPDDGIETLKLTEALVAGSGGSLRLLIRDCLDGSLDLQALSQPDAESLLASWESLPDAKLLLVRHGGQLGGLAVLSCEPQIDSSLVTTLQYLGVARAFRRRGLARRLLRHVRVSMTQSTESEQHGLVAYCDRQNTPAMNLYQNSGFTPGDVHTIWTRQLAKH